jgi:hypothetical protein
LPFRSKLLTKHVVGDPFRFIKKAQGVRLKVIKNWCQQILDGLDYLHTREPAIIHRDIKCDNIFINGSLGQVKIGDLGLATILNQSGAMMKQSIIGTPEFMAPEYYEEKYDEKVDIWAFGMSVLEMATMDYPFCECDNPAQIFKKVSTGQKPRSLARIADPDVYTFIDDCLQAVEHRSSAAELLKHPFLQNIDDDSNNKLIDLRSEAETIEWLDKIKKDAIPFEFRPSWQKRNLQGPRSGLPAAHATPGVGAHAPEAGATNAGHATPVTSHPTAGSSGPFAPTAGGPTLHAGAPVVVVTNPDELTIGTGESEEEEEDELDFDGDDYDEDDVDDDDMDDDVAFSHTTPPIMPVAGPGAVPAQHPYYHPAHVAHPTQPAAAPVHKPVTVTTPVVPPVAAPTVPVTQPPVTFHPTSIGTAGDDTISLKIDAGWPPSGVPLQQVPADPTTVNLKCSLTIGRQVTVIEFEYNIVRDTPLQVATEMVRELQLGDNCVPEIAAYLEAKVTEYVKQRNLPLHPVSDERLRALREQLIVQSANEPLRLSSPGRAPAQSRVVVETQAAEQLSGPAAALRRTQSTGQQRRRRVTESSLVLNGVNPAVRTTASAGAAPAARPPRPTRADSTADVSRHVRKKSRTKTTGLMRKSQSQSNVILSSDGHSDSAHSNGATDSAIHLEELQDFKKLVESNNVNFENALAAFDSVSLQSELLDSPSPATTPASGDTSS